MINTSVTNEMIMLEIVFQLHLFDNMKNNTCLGCRTYLQEGEKLPFLESMFIEFKNYYLPLKESKQKWILLKTMTGFLNSKGGTIYIGVEDKQGQVIGLELKRKEQDEFLLFLKGFIERIRPAVDLVNREEISVVYIPVVTNKVFRGKYVIKIIVKQGDPSKTYHFGQKIELEHRGKIDELEIFHAFYRHNMGGVVEIRGQPLLQEIARKAATPNETVLTFHKFCNPDPLKLDGPLTKLGFSGIRRQQLRTKLQEVFHNNLQSLDVGYQLTYDIQNQVLLIELQNPQQFKQINKYVKDNLNKFNQEGLFNFVEKGEYLDFYLYKNMSMPGQMFSDQNRGRERSPMSPKDIPRVVSKEDKQEGGQAWEYVTGEDDEKSEHKIQQKKCDQLIKNSKQKEIYDKVLEKQFILTITHIQADKRDDLEAKLKLLIDKQINVDFKKYVHTLELKFESRQNVLSFHTTLMKNSKGLAEFGVQNNLVIGINMQKIRINNYDRNKKKELKTFIQSILGNKAEEVQFKKSNNKFFLECKFKDREQTCEWLDKLLGEGEIKQFMIPGSEMGKANKLHIYIYCICN